MRKGENVVLVLESLLVPRVASRVGIRDLGQVRAGAGANAGSME